MKIDLYNNHEQYIQEQRQDHAISKWCRKRGIPIDVVKNHPQFKDVAFLLEFRNEFEKEYKTMKSLMLTVTKYWNIVYIKKKSLDLKAFNKFESIANKCIKIRHQQQLKIQIIKKIRHQQRGSANPNNIGHDNKAKGPCLPGVANLKGIQQECHAVPKGCVNHEVCDAHELWW